MNTLARFIAGLAMAATVSAAPPARYAELCVSCHTADPAAFFASSPLVTRGMPAEIAQAIRNGNPTRGMPAFATLPPSDIDALATYLHTAARSPARPTMIGRTIEAEDLRFDRSAGFAIAQEGDTRFLQYIDRGSHLCYDDVDLTGVRSVVYRYAKGDGEPPRRFALVAFRGEFGGGGERIVLGENPTPLTGGWTTFQDHRIGLARELAGRHRLCFIGMGGGGVFNFDRFTLSDAPGTNDGITLKLSASDETITAGGHSFRLQKVADIDGEIWSLEFLDARTMLATQKSGDLWFFRSGRRVAPIADTPRVAFMGQGGLLAVRKHPNYRRNGWIYLSYTESRGDTAMLAIVRGRIRDGHWVDAQPIWRADARLFTNSGEHFGGRLAFDGDYLFFSLGERGRQDDAQDLGNPLGKIHRIHDDGRIPADNPFTTTPGAVPSIWSYGHRNPQGLFTHGGKLWSTEHGPKGGDELNLIARGGNYGWPLVTHGINYDGSIVSERSEAPGLEPPLRNWNPSPGLSNLAVYDGRAFPRWRGALLVSTLAYQQLKLIRVEHDRVVSEEILLDGVGRFRDVIVGPDGLPYVALNQPNGQIFRLVPR
jgi:glucose/arabinose dehydrogenase